LPVSDGQGGLLRPKARWNAVDFHALPGWSNDRHSEAWPALWRSCQKPNQAWARLCTQVRERGEGWGSSVGDDFVRLWFEQHLQAWQVRTLDGGTTGLLTGYFEPLLEGRRRADARFRYPLHRPPADLGTRKPHFTRADLEQTAAGRAAIAGRELVYLADPLDVLMIQVQGSGKVRMLDERGTDGQPRVVRMAFAGHNSQPYQSVARWLVDQGAVTLDQASWDAIRNWAARNPQRVSEMMNANPRVVYFREEVPKEADVGPVGAQGVPLTPQRSIAVDRDAVPLGTPVWIDTTVPQAWNKREAPQDLHRLVLAQDTGGAILGGVRADYFWGAGDEALLHAARTKQSLAMWVLWPREASPR